MGKLDQREIDNAMEKEDMDDGISLPSTTRREEIIGGRQSNKTPEGLAKKDDSRVYGKRNTK